jgi:hypothetical protein
MAVCLETRDGRHSFAAGVLAGFRLMTVEKLVATGGVLASEIWGVHPIVEISKYLKVIVVPCNGG